jgi:hypothetical protein
MSVLGVIVVAHGWGFLEARSEWGGMAASDGEVSE